MRKKGIVAVLIPIYKPVLTHLESLSLKRCFKILSNYPIIFITPYQLNVSEYALLLPGKNYQVARFENQYFESIDGYNQLMLSPGFYKRFLNYKFILIHQLDAYVFKDELLYWCSQNFDFIGAPHAPEKNLPGEMQFLKNYGRFLKIINKIFKIDHKISYVGNGGLSLRKTLSFYLLLKILKYQVVAWGRYNEDGFFKYWGNIFYPLFKLPADETALKFAIETSPKESLEKLNGRLPFGCHAFEKYSFETWKPFIS
jgi:hypothetical protein